MKNTLFCHVSCYSSKKLMLQVFKIYIINSVDITVHFYSN